MGVNEVKVNGQVLMTTRGDSVDESNLVQGETATNSKGEKITGELDPVTHKEVEELKKQLDELSNDAYKVSDSEGDIQEDDYIPFNDVEDSEKPKKKTLFSTIIDTIRQSFFNIFYNLADSSNISSGEDLNSYIDSGTYSCLSGATASSLSNCPVNVAFKLMVDSGVSIRQTITIVDDLNGYVWTRQRVGMQNPLWSAWKAIDNGGGGDSKTHTYEAGTPIPASSDLDTYVTEGVYKIAPDTTAQTISNVPSGSDGVIRGGKLVISKGFSVNETYVMQVYTSNAGHVFTRMTTDNGTTWGDWTQIGLHNEELTADYSTEITSGDLNNVLTYGTYYWSFASSFNISNTPKDSASVMYVYKVWTNNKYIKQVVVDRSNNEIYTRSYYADGTPAWSDWEKVAFASEVSPSTIGDGYAVATVSGSAITATISGFQLRAGAIVTLKCNFDMPANASLNISSTGAKQIMWWLDNGIRTIDNQSLNGMTITFMYDGTYYRIISVANTPRLFPQNYVANTSGSVVIASGYDQNAFQIKYRLEYDKLLWNYYKNSAWRGDVTLADYDDIKHQTLGKSIPANSDLNDYTTNGIYNIAQNATAQTIANCPCERAGKLVVERIAGSSYIVQTYYTYYQDMAMFDGVYRRAYSTNWTFWHSVAFIQDDGENRFLYLMGETTTANDRAVGIKARIRDTTTGNDYTRRIMNIYQDHQATPAGLNLVMDSGGSLILGGGEAGLNHYNALAKPHTSENIYLTSDGNIYLQANASTISNRLGFRIDVSGNLVPCKEDVIVDNQGKIGGASYKLQEIWTYKINNGDVVNSISLADTSLDKVQRLGGISERRIDIPDNSGYAKFLKFCDVTEWYNSTTTGQPVLLFVGWLVASREGGYATTSEIAEIELGVAYEKSTQVNNASLVLSTSNDRYYPVILKEVLDGVTKYFLALRVRGSGRQGYLLGHFKMSDYSGNLFDGTWVNCTDSNETLPTGYSIEISGKTKQRESAYATCSTAGDQQIKVASIADPTWNLRVGVVVGVKFSNTNTYSSTTANPIKLNINNTGAKNIWYDTTHSGAGNTGTNTTAYGYADRISYYMYDGTYWCWISFGKESDTVDPRALGSGYGVCDTAEATTAKVATLSSYTLRTGGIVAVRFAYNVPANSTLNINSRGAKPIFQRTWAITSNVIKSGDIATFVYDGTNYVLLGTDRTERQFANYRYANSAGTPDATYLTRNDTSVLFTELSYIRRGDTVMFGCVVRFASSKTYSASTKIATLEYSSLQICYPHASFYISGNGLYARNQTYNGYYYLQCTYIAS